MKIQTTILTILFILSSFGVLAQPQSDYEIQKAFKKEYAELEDKVEEVSSPDSLQMLIESIKMFDQKYSEHADLLDKALYPDKYEQRIEGLKESSVIAMNRLQTINQQSTKLGKLETQLAGYELELQMLTRETDSLKQAMNKSIQSEKQLSDMVRKYRNNLEKRDDLILAFIDSMIVAYQQMDLKSLQDLENVDQKSRIKTNDALQMIHSISVENLDILENNADKLNLEDYMRMARVQDQFEEMWMRLGIKIKEVYSGKDTEKIAGKIDKNISRWKELLKSQTFFALRDSLAANGITLKNLQNPDELYSYLSSYLDEKIMQTREGSTSEGYEDFKQFRRFWNRLELQWADNIVDAGIIDKDQLALINGKVDTWAEIAQPRTNNILVYLLGASVLLVVALGVMLIREKKIKNQQA